jgi:Resolvase, N terminal domain/Helix-turn-helix domain of resolvase
VGLRERGIGLRSLNEAIDTTTLGGRLVFHVFAALAEFIRELIVEGILEGLDAARARGQRLGRPPVMNEEQVSYARALLAQPNATVPSIARLLQVSRSTLYKYVPRAQPRCGPAPGRSSEDGVVTPEPGSPPTPPSAAWPGGGTAVGRARPAGGARRGAEADGR